MSTSDLRTKLTQVDAQICSPKHAHVVAAPIKVAVQQRPHKIATFPVLTLPVEITIQIFTHCLPSFENLPNRGPLMGLKAPPAVFLAVCRAWREIALATPALWSTLRLRFDLIPKSDAAFATGQVEEFIHLNEDELDLDVLFPIARVRDIIHLYAHHIAHLELYSSQVDIHKLALDTVDFPILRHALIDGGHWSLGVENPVKIFKSAPQFSELILEDVTDLSHYAFPMHQLTKFEGPLGDLQLFAFAPNLIEVACYVPESYPPPSSVITHTCLQSLRVLDSCYSPDSAMDVLPHLTLPKLRTLDIKKVAATEPASLSEFLDRSGAQLRTLAVYVHDFDANYDEWMECLSQLDDTLEHLDVWPASRRFLVMILSKDSPMPLLRLKSLIVKDAESLSCDFLLESLVARSSHLQSFRICFRKGCRAFLSEWKLMTNGTDKSCHSLGQLAQAGTIIRVGKVRLL
ncbi:hypothetical protein FB45DRAFT_905452 [Roridomyces roridus]|uniref:F-box domain-containing protein n=1 Tax=Roridomyces roridus TaxID=1738132 RepID=A0AAD7C5V2_9AGAR|nr:hypothetical protein FB45DRAFT_905452 [Roridomyces roridus]